MIQAERSRALAGVVVDARPEAGAMGNYGEMSQVNET